MLKLKRSFLGSIAGLALFAFAGQALAADLPGRRVLVAPPQPEQNMFYVRGDVGVSFLSDASEGIILGTGVGWQFSQWLRTDITIDYTFGSETDATNTEIDFITAMANVYVDIPTGTMFTPYIGLGAGYANIKFDPGNSEDKFVFGATLGVSTALTTDIHVDFNYRYLDAGSEAGVDLDAHQIRLGVRYYF